MRKVTLLCVLWLAVQACHAQPAETVAALPVTATVAVLATASNAGNQAENTYTARPIRPEDREDTYRAGIQYNVSPALGLRSVLRYKRASLEETLNGNGFTTISLGVNYKF